MRSLVAVAVAIALLLAGCGGSGSEQRAVAPGDLPGIADPPPPYLEWTPENESTVPRVFSLAFLRSQSTTAAERKALRVIENAGFQRGYQRAWDRESAAEGGSAQVGLFLFRDESGTAGALGAMRPLVRDSEAEDVGVLREVDPSGLGEEGWGVRISDEDEEAGVRVYAWRSRNLVALVFMVCAGECDSVGERARAYADAIDERIEQVGA